MGMLNPFSPTCMVNCFNSLINPSANVWNQASTSVATSAPAAALPPDLGGDTALLCFSIAVLLIAVPVLGDLIWDAVRRRPA